MNLTRIEILVNRKRRLHNNNRSGKWNMLKKDYNFAWLSDLCTYIIFQKKLKNLNRIDLEVSKSDNFISRLLKLLGPIFKN